MKTVVMLCVVAAAVVPAAATVIVPADLGELSRDARAIVRGRVTAVDGRWTDDRRTIETLVTLEVESYWKGSLGATLQFRVPGGELGRYRSIVVGAPEFSLDQDVVVFLGTQGPMIPYVLGLNQGVYRVARAPDGSALMVTPPPMLPAAGASTPVVRGDVRRRPLPLADFESRVRAMVGGAK